MKRNSFFQLFLTLFLSLSIPMLATAQCSQPSNLNVVNTTPNSVVLSWSAAQGGATYTLQYRVQGTTVWTTVNNGLAISRTVSGLLASTVYQYRVKASCSTYSSIAIFNTGGSGGNASCSQPSNLEATNVTLNSATINWSIIDGAFSYTVQYRRTGTTAWVSVSNVTGASTTVSGLLANATYQFRVKASCSVYSSIATFTTGNSNNGGGTGGGGSTSCSAPSNTNVDAVTATTAAVSWEPVSGAASYLVQFRLENASTYTTAGTVTVANALLTGLIPGSQYVYRVKANCSPNGSDVQFSTPLAMISNEETASNVFPNPVTDNYITVQGPEGSRFELINVTGRKFQSGMIETNEQVINVSDLTKGLYLIRLIKPNGSVEVLRLQVNH